VVGEAQDRYELVWPPTIMINKATALEERHQTITWGAGQLGIAQGVLDAVADGLIPASQDMVVFVCIWIDPGASDETAVREAARTAVRRAIGVCVNRPDAEAARSLVERRDSLTSPFYGGS
jgi:formaldehyde-activating enzyme